KDPAYPGPWSPGLSPPDLRLTRGFPISNPLARVLLRVYLSMAWKAAPRRRRPARLRLRRAAGRRWRLAAPPGILRQIASPHRRRASHERSHAHPVRHRTRRPAGRRAALAARLRRIAKAGFPEAIPREARADAPGHCFGA